jgi:hypothetical protein
VIRYTFADDAILAFKGSKDASAQQIGEALDGIRQNAGGELEPARVVETARSPDHPLHPYFEWDDKKAAGAYRLDQARALIRIVRVETDDGETPRAFLSVTRDSGVSYRSLGDVQSSKDLQAAVLASAERDLEAFEKRYRELKDICQIVGMAKEAVRTRRRKFENRAAA